MEENEGYGIRPAPGTCCPDMRIKDGVCQGCGRVHLLKIKVFVECPEKGSVSVGECVECEFFDSLNPVDAVYCKNLRFNLVEKKPVQPRPKKKCLKCGELNQYTAKFCGFCGAKF